MDFIKWLVDLSCIAYTTCQTEQELPFHINIMVKVYTSAQRNLDFDVSEETISDQHKVKNMEIYVATAMKYDKYSCVTLKI